MRSRVDKAMVVSFDTSAELVSDLIDDTDKLETAIRGLRPGGGTALYDAIFFACRDKLAQDQPRHKFRRAIVILSDGDDNQSRYTRDQALEMAQKADVVIYAISTNMSRHRNRWRQGPAILLPGDRRPRLLPLQSGGPGAVFREHRQRAAPPVQHLLPARAARSPTACFTTWICGSRAAKTWWCAAAAATTRPRCRRSPLRPPVA